MPHYVGRVCEHGGLPCCCAVTLADITSPHQICWKAATPARTAGRACRRSLWAVRCRATVEALPGGRGTRANKVRRAASKPREPTRCADINECADADRCDPLTACVNTAGDHYCEPCPAGFHSYTYPDNPKKHSCVRILGHCHGNLTTELGDSFTCNVALSRVPSSAVTLVASSSDGSEATTRYGCRPSSIHCPGRVCACWLLLALNSAPELCCSAPGPWSAAVPTLASRWSVSVTKRWMVMLRSLFVSPQRKHARWRHCTDRARGQLPVPSGVAGRLAGASGPQPRPLVPSDRGRQANRGAFAR